MYFNYGFKTASVAMVIILTLLSFTAVSAQDTGQTGLSIDASTDTEDDGISAKDITRWSILGGTIPVTFLFGVKAWKWGDRHNPKSEREYWFGENTSFGGADKAGHFFAHYAVQRATYNVFDWTEDGGDRKWAYSLGSTMTVGLFIELGDAFTSQYGFSYEDLIMDYTGILIGAALDYSPVLDGFFGFSVEYIPTDGYFARYDKSDVIASSLEFVNDYSGWQYMLNFKPAGFRNLGFDVPFALRILSIDIGWYTKGYSDNDFGKYARKKERDFFAGISVNSAQLLSELWPSEHRNTAYTISHTALEYYHLPYDRLPVPTRYVNDLNR